jgi:acetyltransferase, GNAT family
MRIKIRKFEKSDIPIKVEWVNNPENNLFLHYDIPIEIGKTERWFENNLGRNDRYDGIIEADGCPVGLIGLLSIDKKNNKAEYYVMMGNTDFKGKGIAKEASRQIINYGFYELGLNRIYLFTEVKNDIAQKLFERVGFTKEGCLRADLLSHGKFVDRYVYSILKKDWEKVNGRG